MVSSGDEANYDGRQNSVCGSDWIVRTNFLKNMDLSADAVLNSPSAAFFYISF